tara:strand:+ start:313 stop:729 length:417 start_codon:yes stop_codon:yes gene_type:complete
VKKRFSPTKKDKLDWGNFTENLENVHDKDGILDNKRELGSKIPKLDLHGVSLSEANIMVKKFILKAHESKHRKVIIITGKGTRSKVHEDPYRSKNLNILMNSVPEYINTAEDFNNKIKKISKADLKSGGEGVIHVYLK